MGAKEKIDSAIARVESETNFEILAEVKAALNMVFGEERNQIVKPSYRSVMDILTCHGTSESIFLSQFDRFSSEEVYRYLADCRSLSYHIIIHFPEVTIRNDDNQHLIRNIYVRLVLKPNGTFSHGMDGMRTTVTEQEFMAGYLHSHLRKLDPNAITFRNFCLGVGEINQVFSLLTSKFTSANLMMLLMHIKNYLEWESIEGTPYVYMKSIFGRGNIVTVGSIPWASVKLITDGLISIMIKELDPSEIMNLFTFKVSETSIGVKATPEAEKWMAKIIESGRLPSARSGYDYPLVVFKDTEGKYYHMSGERSINYQKGPILNFKGRDIEFEVIERKQKEENEKFANPQITEETCKKLSHITIRTAIATAGIRSGSSLIYSTSPAESDQIPMQGDLDGRMVGDALL